MRIEPLALAPIGSRIMTESVAVTAPAGKTFGEFLTEALGEVNGLQKEAATASYRLAAGQLEDVSQVTIAAEKASIAMQLTMQVRNKAIDAYQEVMRMQV